MSVRSHVPATAIVTRAWGIALLGANMLAACGGGEAPKVPQGSGGISPTPTETATSKGCSPTPDARELTALAKRLPVSVAAAEPAALALLAFAGKVPTTCLK